MPLRRKAIAFLCLLSITLIAWPSYANGAKKKKNLVSRCIAGAVNFVRYRAADDYGKVRIKLGQEFYNRLARPLSDDDRATLLNFYQLNFKRDAGAVIVPKGTVRVGDGIELQEGELVEVTNIFRDLTVEVRGISKSGEPRPPRKLELRALLDAEPNKTDEFFALQTERKATRQARLEANEAERAALAESLRGRSMGPTHSTPKKGPSGRRPARKKRYDKNTSAGGEESKGLVLRPGVAFDPSGITFTDRYLSDARLAEIAEDVMASHGRAVGALIEQLKKGNMNPGSGSHQFRGSSGVIELRSRVAGGPRVFVRRSGPAEVEIVGIGNKKYERQMERLMHELYPAAK